MEAELCKQVFWWQWKTVIKLPRQNIIWQWKTVTRLLRQNIIEPQHDKTSKMTCAPSEDSDQLGHPPSLIRAYWLCAVSIAKNPRFLHADSKYLDQTERMSRLIFVFAGRTCRFADFLILCLILSFATSHKQFDFGHVFHHHNLSSIAMKHVIVKHFSDRLCRTLCYIVMKHNWTCNVIVKVFPIGCRTLCCILMKHNWTCNVIVKNFSEMLNIMEAYRCLVLVCSIENLRLEVSRFRDLSTLGMSISAVFQQHFDLYLTKL